MAPYDVEEAQAVRISAFPLAWVGPPLNPYLVNTWSTSA